MLERIRELMRTKTHVGVYFKSGNCIYGKFRKVNEDGWCLFGKMKSDEKAFENSEFSHMDIERIDY